MWWSTTLRVSRRVPACLPAVCAPRGRAVCSGGLLNNAVCLHGAGINAVPAVLFMPSAADPCYPADTGRLGFYLAPKVEEEEMAD